MIPCNRCTCAGGSACPPSCFAGPYLEDTCEIGPTDDFYLIIERQASEFCFSMFQPGPMFTPRWSSVCHSQPAAAAAVLRYRVSTFYRWDRTFTRLSECGVPVLPAGVCPTSTDLQCCGPAGPGGYPAHCFSGAYGPDGELTEFLIGVLDVHEPWAAAIARDAQGLVFPRPSYRGGGTGRLAESFLCWVRRATIWHRDRLCESKSPEPAWWGTQAVDSGYPCRIPEDFEYACTGTALFLFQLDQAVTDGVISTDERAIVVAACDPSEDDSDMELNVEMSEILRKLWCAGVVATRDWRGDHAEMLDLIGVSVEPSEIDPLGLGRYIFPDCSPSAAEPAELQGAWTGTQEASSEPLAKRFYLPGIPGGWTWYCKWDAVTDAWRNPYNARRGDPSLCTSESCLELNGRWQETTCEDMTGGADCGEMTACDACDEEADCPPMIAPGCGTAAECGPFTMVQGNCDGLEFCTVTYVIEDPGCGGTTAPPVCWRENRAAFRPHWKSWVWDTSTVPWRMRPRTRSDPAWSPTWTPTDFHLAPTALADPCCGAFDPSYDPCTGGTRMEAACVPASIEWSPPC